MNRAAWEVARWEFIRTMRERAFIVSTVVMPLLILLLAVGLPMLIGWLTNRPEQADRHTIAVRDKLGLYATLEAKLAGSTISLQRVEGLSEDELKERLGELDGVLVLPEDLLETGVATLMISRFDRDLLGGIGDEPNWVQTLRKLVREVVRDERFRRAGIPPDVQASLNQGVLLDVIPLEDPSREISKTIFAIALIMLLGSSLASGPMYLLIAIISEKSQRVTELIVSAIPAQAWMDGKILGYSAVGLLQALFWGIAGLGLALAARAYWKLPLPQVTIPELLLYWGYFLLGNLLLNTLYAAVSATMKDLHTSSGFQGYLMMLTFLGFGFVFAALTSPEAAWVRVLSFLPLWTPFLMPVRLALGGVAWWEVTGTLLVLGLSVYLLRLLAGKIFRVGMLLYGQQASLGQVLKWVRG